MNKPKIFIVTRTPKGSDGILVIQPEEISENFCAVINVSDSPCATFDYQNAGIPSFWFPVNEIGQWGHSPFFGTLKVVNQYYTGDKPVLIHCHAGANRSPSIAYAILLAKGYSPQEAEISLNYPDLRLNFKRNVERKHIPSNIIEFLKEADDKSLTSLNSVLRRMDSLYEEWAQKKLESQQNCVICSDSGTEKTLVYDSEKKRYIIK